MPEASLVPSIVLFVPFEHAILTNSQVTPAPLMSLLSREGGTLVSSAQSGGYVRRVPQLVWSSWALDRNSM